MAESIRGSGLSKFVNKTATRIRMPAGKGKRKCKDCGYRIRGRERNHKEGAHHKSGRK